MKFSRALSSWYAEKSHLTVQTEYFFKIVSLIEIEVIWYETEKLRGKNAAESIPRQDKGMEHNEKVNSRSCSTRFQIHKWFNIDSGLSS